MSILGREEVFRLFESISVILFLVGNGFFGISGDGFKTMRGKILKIAIAVLVVMAVGCVLIMPSQQAEERIPSVSLSSFVCHVVEQKMDEKILQEADVSLNFKHAEIYNGETLHLMASLGTKVKERDIVSSWTVSNPAIA